MQCINRYASTTNNKKANIEKSARNGELYQFIELTVCLNDKHLMANKEDKIGIKSPRAHQSGMARRQH